MTKQKFEPLIVVLKSCFVDARIYCFVPCKNKKLSFGTKGYSRGLVNLRLSVSLELGKIV